MELRRGKENITNSIDTIFSALISESNQRGWESKHRGIGWRTCNRRRDKRRRAKRRCQRWNLITERICWEIIRTRNWKIRKMLNVQKRTSNNNL